MGEVSNEKWIDERIIKNKYEDLFKELSKELYGILVFYKSSEGFKKLNYKLSAKLDWYKDKINKIREGEDDGRRAQRGNKG